MVGFWRRGEDDELDDEIAGVLGVSREGVRDFMAKIPELEKVAKNQLTSAIALRLSRLGWTQDEIGAVIGLAKSNVSEKCSDFPELEKQIKNLVTSNIPHDDVAKRHALPELKAVGNPSGVNQYTPEEERNPDIHKISSFGTSAEYRARKLKRDHPDVFQQKQNPHHVGNPGGGRLRRQCRFIGIVKWLLRNVNGCILELRSNIRGDILVGQKKESRVIQNRLS